MLRFVSSKVNLHQVNVLFFNLLLIHSKLKNKKKVTLWIDSIKFIDWKISYLSNLILIPWDISVWCEAVERQSSHHAAVACPKNMSPCLHDMMKLAQLSHAQIKWWTWNKRGSWSQSENDKQQSTHLSCRVFEWFSNTGVRSSPSRVLSSGGLMPARARLVVNRSITLANWKFTCKK